MTPDSRTSGSPARLRGQLGQSADRHAAAGAERGQEAAFGDGRGPARRVIQGAELSRGNRVIGAALDGQHALRRGGHQQRWAEGRGGTVEEAEPRQSRHRQHEGVDFTVGELAQPGVDVPAYRHDLQLAAGGAEQGGPPG